MTVLPWANSARAVGKGPERAQMAALLERLDNSSGVDTVLSVGGLAVLIGTLPLTIGLILGRAAPAWAAIATVSLRIVNGSLNDSSADVNCQLRNGDTVIGAATDRRIALATGVGIATVTINGGAQIDGSGGEVTVWCRAQQFVAARAQIMFLRIGGFS